MVKDNSHGQTLIYNRQGTIHECYEDGSFIWLVDNVYSAQALRTMMGNLLNMTIIQQSGANSVALSRGWLSNAAGISIIDSVPIIPSRHGLVIISLDVDTVVSGSIMMCSPYSGQVMTIAQRGAVAANTAGWALVFSAGTSGGILSGIAVIDDSDTVSISLIEFLASASQHPWITFFSPNGDEWSVLKYGSKGVLLDNARGDDVITINPDG